MGGDHGPVDETDGLLRSGIIRRWVVAAVLVCAAATAAGLVAIWPGPTDDVLADTAFGGELVDATVTAEEAVVCAGLAEGAEEECARIEIELTSGPTAGESGSFELFGASGPDLDVGDEIVVNYVPDSDPEFQYSFADFQRRTVLWVLAGLFAVSVLVLGLFKGLRALLGALVSIAALLYVVLPALLEGTSPMLVALVASSAIALLALYLTHGVTYRTSVAYLGTVASLGLTGLLASIFTSAGHITGLSDEDAIFLQVSADQIDLTGLLLAGIVIGTLGVLDDVTITQVSAVWELRRSDPDAPRGTLYRSALRVGRDHIASTVNTLVLAYAGASLPLLLLFTQAGRSFGDVTNSEIVAIEIIRALVGSIGLVASVPLTTGLAALVIGTRTGPAPPPPGDPSASTPESTEPPDPAPEPEPEPEPDPEPASWEDFLPTEEEF